MNCNPRCWAKDLSVLLSPSISSMRDAGVGAALLSGGRGQHGCTHRAQERRATGRRADIRDRRTGTDLYFLKNSIAK